MSKVQQTNDELSNQLRDQLQLLKVLADAYDSGQAIAAKSIATSIRVLLHDTDKSHSLLGQLSLKTVQFHDSCTVGVTPSPNVQVIGSFCGLVSIAVGGNHHYIPYLDEPMGDVYGLSSFDEYWNRVIFKDKENNEFTRRDIVLAVANQDGGAHVDPNIDEKYKKLTRQNTLGWVVTHNDSLPTDAKGAELASIRQIAHELLRTFDPTYPKKRMVNQGAMMMLGGIGIIFSNAKEAIFGKKKYKGPKVGRNEKCPCGSGQKFKKCCGK